MSAQQEFGPVTYYEAGAVMPPAIPESLRQDYKTLNIEGATQFADLMGQSLSDMDNLLHATRSQSTKAMEAADLTTSLLTEALNADPEAFDVVGGYNGPLAMISHLASNAHRHQTGHALEGAYYKGINGTREQGMNALGVVKQKILDRTYDGPHARDGADATAAHSRKGIALHAAEALKQIAEQRGVALMSPETVAATTEYLARTVRPRK